MSGAWSLEDSKSLIETIFLEKFFFLKRNAHVFSTESLNRLFLILNVIPSTRAFVFWCLATKMAGNDGKEIESFLSKIDKVCK